jgi:hypothetical protein
MDAVTIYRTSTGIPLVPDPTEDDMDFVDVVDPIHIYEMQSTSTCLPD